MHQPTHRTSAPSDINVSLKGAQEDCSTLLMASSTKKLTSLRHPTEDTDSLVTPKSWVPYIYEALYTIKGVNA